MDANELRMLIQQKEHEFERRKIKRMILVVLIYAAAHFGIIYLQGQLHAENIWHIIGEIASCIFLGGITWYFNLLIWSRVFKKSQDENNALETLRKILKDKEQREHRTQKE